MNLFKNSLIMELELTLLHTTETMDYGITLYRCASGIADLEYGYEEEEGSDVDRELRPVARLTGKHIAAGEERPRINSSQQTTPTDGKY